LSAKRREGIFAIDNGMSYWESIVFWTVFFITAVGLWLFPFITSLFVVDPLQPVLWGIPITVVNVLATIWWIKKSSKR